MYIVHTHILCKQKLLFWMWLIAINRLTALLFLVLSGVLWDFFTYQNCAAAEKRLGNTGIDD